MLIVVPVFMESENLEFCKHYNVPNKWKATLIKDNTCQNFSNGSMLMMQK